jgi:hypothetical protein
MTQQEAYLTGFKMGRIEERKLCLEYFAMKLLEIKEIDGIGEITYEKIVKFIDGGLPNEKLTN